MQRKIKGRFDPNGTPWLDAVVRTSWHNQAEVSFLVSTGAPRTTIRGQDAARLDAGKDPEDPNKPTRVTMTFGQGAKAVTTQAQVWIRPTTLEPSVIGWDILRHWSMHYDFSRGILELQTEPHKGIGPAESPHQVLHAFLDGKTSGNPSENTMETAAMILKLAQERATANEMTVGEDGTLSFELRLNSGLLAAGELGTEGNLSLNVYQDQHPDPQADIDRIWLRHIPEASRDDLMELN